MYKLLGGKVRDKVRVYNGGVRVPMDGNSPEHYAEDMARMKELKEGFSNHQAGNRFPLTDAGKRTGLLLRRAAPGGKAGVRRTADGARPEAHGRLHRGDEGRARRRGRPRAGLWPRAHGVGRAAAGKGGGAAERDVAGGYDHRGLYALRPAGLVPRSNDCDTPTPIHTGEQIYLRQNFKDLIEKKAVNVIGPDPLDVGGIAELKWIAEHADLHGILVAPHGIADGLIGLAAHVHLAATLPRNYIALEYPVGRPAWWYDLIEGLPDPIVEDGFINVWDTPGLGVEVQRGDSKEAPVR